MDTFNHNAISASGRRSKVVRTLVELSRECDLPMQRIIGIASHHPLPLCEFEIYKKGNLTKHYALADLHKWLADWRAKTAKKLEVYK